MDAPDRVSSYAQAFYEAALERWLAALEGTAAKLAADPATLARDAVPLTATGYCLVEAQPVDLFPQTFHVETVALWEK